MNFLTIYFEEINFVYGLSKDFVFNYFLKIGVRR